MTQPRELNTGPRSAPRRPHSFTTHGITVTDDYAWLKDANWQEVLRDPSVLDAGHPQTISKRKTPIPKACSAIPTRLQKKLVAEMRGRIKEDDSSVPAPDGPFAYFRKFREGGQHELFGRTPRDGGEIEIMLDGDELAADDEYFKFGGSAAFARSPPEAWSADIKGSEYFSDPRARLGRSARTCDDIVEETDGAVVWSTDCNELLLRQARRQPSPDAGLAPSARHAADGRRAGL